MSDEPLQEDQSHYEISLTAGQAFVAFVLLLLSLAASFAFGLMIGKGQADERLVVRKEPAVVAEGPAKKSEAKLVDLGIANSDDFKAKTDTTLTDTVAPLTASTPQTATTASAPEASAPTQQPAPAPVQPQPATSQHPSVPTSQPVYAQLLSTLDQKTADTLAAKLIDAGFTSAYVERGAGDKGTMFKVRVKFPTEAEARGAETKLHEFSRDVWIVR
jgi:cell division septation protein DedD